MTSVNILEIVAILLLLINHSNTLDLLCKGEVNPSLGDLCLDRDKSLQGVPLLLVYSRGIDLPPKWGTICDDQVDRTALTTMCQQLGYDNGIYQEVWGYNDVDPWFSEVTCGSQTTQNILRCPFAQPNNRNCSKIYLDCGPDDSWNKVPKEGYIGQVLLLHPEITAPGHQVSFGLVLIYMHLNGYNSWGVITQDKTQPFTPNAANSVCRQMGYTEADPKNITTAKNSYDPTSLQHNAWLSSINTRDCMDSSEPCFSCCFTKPTTPLCSVDTCLFEDGIVLKCLFDKNKKDLPEGNNESCRISDYTKPISCTGTPTPGTPGTPGPPNYEATIISLASVSAVLLLIIIVILGVCCYCRKKFIPAVAVNPDQQPLVQANNHDEHQN